MEINTKAGLTNPPKNYKKLQSRVSSAELYLPWSQNKSRSSDHSRAKEQAAP